MILYMSTDNGALYMEDDIEDPGHFEQIDVDEPVVLTPKQLIGHDGAIVELLLAAGKARKVTGG